MLASVLNGKPAPDNPIWAADFKDFRAGARALRWLAAYDYGNSNLASGGAAVHVSGMEVTADFFPALGVAPARGRAFEAGDMDRRQVVLSDSLWRKQFGGAPMVGHPILLDGVEYRVIGIMPAGFSHFFWPFDSQMWIPLRFTPAQLQHARNSSRSVFVVGRLRPQATLAEVKSQIEALSRQEAAAHPDEKGMGETALTLQDYFTERDSNPKALWMFVTLAILILLVGCANVAGLGLGRAAARNGEMEIRRALGAARIRLVRQVLTESTVLAGLAAVLGVILGWLGIRLLNAGIDTLNAVLSGRVLAMVVAAVVVTVLCAGLPPALQAAARPQTNGATGGRSRTRDLLVTMEIAVGAASLVLILGLVVSIRQSYAKPLGYNPDGVLAADVALRGPGYAAPEAQLVFIHRLAAALAALPGAKTSGLGSPGPLGWNEASVQVRGRTPISWRGRPMPKIFGITPGYIEALQIPLLAGRGLTPDDVSAPVAIISRSVARQLFPGSESPLGQFIRMNTPGEPWRKIVGVTGDVGTYLGDDGSHGDVFEPLEQTSHAGISIVLRPIAGASPNALISPLRQALVGLDPTLALDDASPLLTTLRSQGEAGDMIFAHLLELIGVLALLLCAIGLYSVVAFEAVRSRRELGVRQALGATPAQLQRMLFAAGGRLASWGIISGLLLGWAGLRLFNAGSDPTVHPWTVCFAALASLTTAAVVATWLPARRASRTDPLTALHAH
jgi:predicted permease